LKVYIKAVDGNLDKYFDIINAVFAATEKLKNYKENGYIETYAYVNEDVRLEQLEELFNQIPERIKIESYIKDGNTKRNIKDREGMKCVLIKIYNY
jgi:hypothetical protein